MLYAILKAVHTCLDAEIKRVGGDQPKPKVSKEYATALMQCKLAVERVMQFN